MPTDTGLTETPPEPAAPAKPASDPHKGMRLAVGVAGIFVLGMLLEWPFAFLAAVFASLFLQAPAPPSGKAGLSLVVMAFALLLFGFVLFSVLLPYRGVFMIAMAIMVIWGFTLSVAGKPPLLVVLALMCALMMPYLASLSLDVALAMAIWLPLNMGLALIAAWTAFALFAPDKAAIHEAAQVTKTAPRFDPERRLLRMTLVTLPFAIAFFMFDGGAVLTLIFVAILSQQLAASTATGSVVAKGMLLANVVGGLVAILAYELIVIDTQFHFMVLVSVLVCLGFARWFASGRLDAALAGSALTTALILLGGAMAPFSDDVDAKMIDRLFQVGAALVWVLTAFVVVDRFLPEREEQPDLPNWQKKQQRGHARTSTLPEHPV